MIEEHVRETQSVFAEAMFSEWQTVRGRFWQICPKEMVSRLEHPLSDAPAAAAEKRA